MNNILYDKDMNEYTVVLFWDSEEKVWVATSEDYPIVLESESFDELLERVRVATPELLEGNNLSATGTLHFKVNQIESLQAAV